MGNERKRIEHWLRDTPPGEMNYIAAANCETLLGITKNLEAERDALAKDVERLRTVVDIQKTALTTGGDTMDALNAEVERLKGLLMEDVMQGPDAPDPEPHAAEGG